MRKVTGLALTLFMSFFLYSCGGEEQQEGDMVAVSLPPQKFFVERMIGDAVEVHLLVPSNSNPETYDPTPKEILRLEQCDAYFAVGTLPFEQQWMDKLKDSAVEIINIADQLPHEMVHESECTHDHTHAHGDPHYWSSFSGGIAMASVIYESLVQLYPEEEELLTTNYQTLMEEINALEQEADKLFNGTAKGASFVIYHPSLSLFAKEWGLTQLVIEENGSDPTPRHLATLIDQAKGAGVKVVFIQEEFEVRNAETIAGELGVEPVVIQPLDEDWFGQMRLMIRAFAP